MEKVDVVIAGAGVAGCMAARDLSKAGYSVLLIERRPIEKLGHDWWDSVEMGVFEEVGVPAPDPPERMSPPGVMRIYSPQEKTSFVTSVLSVKINIDRQLFAQRLLRYATGAGARIRHRAAVIGPLFEDGKVAGLVYRRAGESPEEVRAKLTIDASGMSCALRMRLPEYWAFPRFMARADMFVTYREIRENTNGNTDSLVVFGQDNGLRWINRGQVGLVDYFAGAINMPGRISPRSSVMKMLNATKGYGRVVRGGYGAPIPVRREFDSLVMPGFMLCGDSGCQCSPIDGSGIVSSLRAGSFAAKAAASALSENRFDEAALWKYNVAYKRSQGAKFAKLDFVQKFMVGAAKSDLELLFAKGIISESNLMIDGEPPKESKLLQLAKLLKIINHPRFVARLLSVFTTADRFEQHYREFPERFDIEQFRLWKEKADRMFTVATGQA